MTYKVDLQVVTSGGQDLPSGLKEYVDSHDISYEIAQSGSDRSIVTFEAQSHDQLVDMIEQAYAPDNESERSQFVAQIRGESNESGEHADGESYLTYGTPEPRSDMDIHKPAPGQPDTQLEEAQRAQRGGEFDHSEAETETDEDQDQVDQSTDTDQSDKK